MAKKSEANRWGVFALEVIGAVIFLWLAFAVLNGNAYENSAWSGATTWLPLLYPAAIIGAIGLFLVSFSNIWGYDKLLTKNGVPVAMCLSMLTGFVTLALTIGNQGYAIVALIAFVLSFVGSAVQHAR